MTSKETSQNPLINLVEFARTRWWTGTDRHDLRAHDIAPDADGLLRPTRDPESGAWHLGLEWDEARDVRQVVVRFAGDAPPDLYVQYWQHTWPTPAPERRPGARRGWIGRDDPWHGRWVTVRAEKVTAGDVVTFTFDPVDLPELRGVMSAAQLEETEHYLARFRRTLKLRLVCGGDVQPVIAELCIYSGTRWREGYVNAHFAPGMAKFVPVQEEGKPKIENRKL